MQMNAGRSWRMLIAVASVATPMALWADGEPAVAQDGAVPESGTVKRPARKPVIATDADAGGEAAKNPAKQKAEAKPVSGSIKSRDPADKSKEARRSRSARKKPEPEAPMANCSERSNEAGYRVVIFPPNDRPVRVALFDRGTNKELQRDVVPSSGKTGIRHARVALGTRSMPDEKLLGGVFLITSYEKGTYYNGVLLADGGDGNMMLERAHLGKVDGGVRQRWQLRLGGSRSLACVTTDDEKAKPRRGKQ